jgi:hypothetical protein
MRLHEFNNHFNTYLAMVRVVLRDGHSTARTIIAAETVHQAKLMLTRIYGDGNVLSISQAMTEHKDMTEATKTLSPQELQVKSLADKAEDYKQQEKALKASQQMAKAQQNLIKARRGPNAS